MQRSILTATVLCLLWLPVAATGQATRDTAAYQRIKAFLDTVPIIDTHNHIRPFDQLPPYVETEHGRGINLYGIWARSYYQLYRRLSPWKPGEPFKEWWSRAKGDFDEARALSQYRYMLPAFQDLYGIDFNTITDEQAASLDQRIFENYRDQKWLYEVITERSNIELMLNDRYWAPLDFKLYHPFEVIIFRVGFLLNGFHPSEFKEPSVSFSPPTSSSDPYHFAREQGLKVESLDDYLLVVDRAFQTAKEHGAVGLKVHTQRSLRFENVEKERAARVFGRPRKELSAEEIKDFEDFMMWRLVELSAKYDLPFQIHTGYHLQPSNPLLLVDLINANPRTKFILFHGGYPWVSETAAIAFRRILAVAPHPSNVWLDSCWLPLISTTMAKRAFHEWLDIIPSDRIMWGADTEYAEGVYASTEFSLRCLAEVLAEKVINGQLREKDARRIGRNILRDNALKLFPQLKERLWKHKGPLPVKHE